MMLKYVEIHIPVLLLWFSVVSGQTEELFPAVAATGQQNWCDYSSELRCPKNWTFQGDKCYMYMGVCANFDEAKVKCGLMCASILPIVHSLDEMQALHDASDGILTGSECDRSEEKRTWLGMQRHKIYPILWQWLDRSHTNFVLVDEPPSQQTQCVFIKVRQNQWQPSRCDLKLPVICQLPARKKLFDCLYHTGNGCPIGWYQGENTCYKLTELVTRFYEAQSQCNSMCNSHLVSIRSKTEENVIAQYLHEVKTTSVWTGLTLYSRYTNTWLWDDSSSYAYTNWGYASTVHQDTGPDGACVVFEYNFKGNNLWQWRDVYCNETSKPLCELPKHLSDELYV